MHCLPSAKNAIESATAQRACQAITLIKEGLLGAALHVGSQRGSCRDKSYYGKTHTIPRWCCNVVTRTARMTGSSPTIQAVSRPRGGERRLGLVLLLIAPGTAEEPCCEYIRFE
jgi:hypothetical protein